MHTTAETIRYIKILSDAGSVEHVQTSSSQVEAFQGSGLYSRKSFKPLPPWRLSVGTGLVCLCLRGADWRGGGEFQDFRQVLFVILFSGGVFLDSFPPLGMVASANVAQRKTAEELVVKEVGEDSAHSVDDEVLDYIVNVLADRSTSQAEIVELLAPFFEQIDVSLSYDEALEMVRELREKLYGVEDEHEFEYQNLKRLAAPTRLGAGVAVAARRGKQRSEDLGGGNSNATLDRSREAARRKDAAMIRKAQRTGAQMKHPLHGEGKSCGQNAADVFQTYKSLSFSLFFDMLLGRTSHNRLAGWYVT